MNKYILISLIVLAIGIGIYFNLPKETMTIIEIPATKLPAIIIP